MPRTFLAGSRSARILLVALPLALCAPTPALAQAEGCDTPYTSLMIAEDLGVMTMALRELNEADFNLAGARMDAGLPCMTEAMPVAAYASAFRFLGAWRYLTGDIDIGTRWFRTSLEVDPAFAWDVNDLPPGHPMREAFESERAMAGQAAVAVDGMVLDPPGGTEILVDGRPLEAARLTTGRPHLVQVVETATRVVRQAWIIEGNALPEDLMITQAEADARAAALAEAQGEGGKRSRKDRDRSVATTTASSATDDPFAVQAVRRVRPAAKTPLLVAGAAGIVASGVVYGLSFPAHDRFEAATTTDELLAAQSATNTLVIASGATLAVGLGLGVVGVQLDGHPGLVLGRRF
ncbi:hypothetical protein L6R53_31990 [Myxococcota bacterium]|nr:hypothetical protein [Myxococcota bacterium]